MDLTKITTPFGLLDKETQEALKAHGGPWELFDGVRWTSFTTPPPDAHPWSTYRVKPQSLTKPSIDWSQLPNWVRAIARDANGQTWAYERTPAKHVAEWAGGGRFARIDEVHASLDPGTCDWRDSLVDRPES